MSLAGGQGICASCTLLPAKTCGSRSSRSCFNCAHSIDTHTHTQTHTRALTACYLKAQPEKPPRCCFRQGRYKMQCPHMLSLASPPQGCMCPQARAYTNGHVCIRCVTCTNAPHRCRLSGPHVCVCVCVCISAHLIDVDSQVHTCVCLHTLLTATHRGRPVADPANKNTYQTRTSQPLL